MRHVFLIPLLLLCSAVAWADLGPKPSMTFVFQEIESLKVVSGALLQAQRADGQDASPLSAFGPQRFRLTEVGAFAMAYSFAPYNILELTLEDGRTLRSQVFSPSGLRSTHRVSVLNGQLVVEGTQLLLPQAEPAEQEDTSQNGGKELTPRNILKFQFRDFQGQKVTEAALITRLQKDSRSDRPNSRRRDPRPRRALAQERRQVLPLEVYGAKYLESRRSMAYMLSPRYELELTLADGTRRVGRIPEWSARRKSGETRVILYQVAAQGDGLLVELRTPTNPAGVLVNTVIKFLL